MSKKDFSLKIFCLTQPLITTEWLSLMGDKYKHSLPFPFEFVETIEEAHVVAWDGVISVKMKSLMEEISAEFSRGRIYLRMGEATTLYKDSSMVELFTLPDSQIVGLPGWNVLPEEMLNALEKCYQKIKHV